MSGSLAELVIDGGISQLKCPVTGIPLIVEHEGFDSDAHHSPHLRFFLDWSDQAWVVDPDDLPDGQAEGQRRVLEIFTNEADFDSQHAMIDACVAALPESALCSRSWIRRPARMRARSAMPATTSGRAHRRTRFGCTWWRRGTGAPRSHLAKLESPVLRRCSPGTPVARSPNPCREWRG